MNTINKQIPKNWRQGKFSDHVALQYGSNLPESKRDGGNVPVYGSNGQVGTHSKALVKGPGLVVGRKGTIGAVTWSDKDFWPIDTTYYVEYDSLIALRWLYYKLQSLGLNRMNTASGTPGLSREEVYKLNLIVPPLPEQQKIAEILGTVDEDIAKTQEVIVATEKIKRGLMQQLFTPQNGWIDTVLSDVATIIMGQSPSSKNYNEVDEGLPLIQGNADIKNRRSIKRFSTSEITKEIKKGDIIMSVRAPVGCIAIASFDSCIGRGICGIQSKNIDKDYLYYYLTSKEDEFEKKAQGSTFTAINSNEVRKIGIVFPKNKEEQMKIASVLSAVDEKISINKKLKAKLTLLKKGLMQDLLSGKVRTK